MPLLDNRLAAGDAVAALRRYSLVTPAGDGLVSVHRLVQAVTIDQMPGDLAGQWRQAAAALIEAAIPADTVRRGPGPSAPRCCRTPRRPLPTTATAWRGSRTISARAAATPPHATLSADRSTRLSGSWARSTRSALTARGNLARWTGEAGDPAGGP